MTDRFTYVDALGPKPYVHPLRTPSGRVLTRVSPPDHPWHRGLWFAIKYVDGDNFWEEAPPFGTVTPRTPGALDGDLDWVRPDGEVALHEHRRISSVPVADDAWALDLTVQLTPLRAVVLDRTPYTTWGGYGGLAFRGAGEWSETRFLLPDGPGDRRLVAVPAAWCDLTGTIGGQPAGISFLDHPQNPRHPTPWYGATRSRVYGEDGWSNFLNAAFLFHEPMPLDEGETLTLRHRLLVHDGAWEPARIQGGWDDWVSGG